MDIGSRKGEGIVTTGEKSWQTRGMTTAQRIRFRSMEDPTTGCWEWMLYRDKNGYGNMAVSRGGRKSPRQAHRVSYEAFVGPIPDGLQIDHLCRNTCCVNPAHLEAVTPRVNTLRSPIAPAAINARMTECKRGHPLTPDNLVLNIKNRRCRICAMRTTMQRRFHHLVSQKGRVSISGKA